MESDRQFSVHVSRALDCIGKSQDMVNFRVEKYKQVKQIKQDLTGFLGVPFELIIAGSKSEGLTATFESDYDYMHVITDVVCADDTSSFRHVNGVSLLEADRRDIPPGYTKLRLVRLEGISDMSLDIIQNSLIQDGNEQSYLSSDLVFDFVSADVRKIKSSTFIPLDRSGPSDPSFCYVVSEDHVLAFQCICPQISLSFFTRHRDFGWPSNDQLVEISSLEGHVVPVGYKGSNTAFLEWRICYTEAERLLICSLNDTQTKLYILLKMVAKTYINSISKEITSYVLKNIVLWLAECCDSETFKEELLVDRLIQALGFLSQCVINNNLPSYMIPERNLFSGKLDLGQRQKLIILLIELIRKGGGLLMGCERLCGTMIVLYKQPVAAKHYKYKRDIIEKLWILKFMKVLKHLFSCNTLQQMLLLWFDDEMSVNVHNTLMYLILPDLEFVRQQGDVFNHRLKLWLS